MVGDAGSLGLRLRTSDDWTEIQRRMSQGETLTPVLPLGDTAGLVWIPKNGCSSLKRAWLQLQGVSTEHLPNNVHGAVLAHTVWLCSEEMATVAENRALLAFWRDPIDRFVSACRSHLSELMTGSLHKKFQLIAAGDDRALSDSLAFHDALFASHRVCSFDDDSDPVAVMNSVAVQLTAWVQCHLDWSHHTLPQVCFLGANPSHYHRIFGMEQMNAVLQDWSNASGVAFDLTPQHVSSSLQHGDHWRRLHRLDLKDDALKALSCFYAADWQFLQRLQPGMEEQHSA